MAPAAARDDDRLARIEERLDALVGGVAMITDPRAPHPGRLERILLAAAEAPPAGGDLAEALRDMANALTAQEAVMARLEARLAALPGEIAEALVPGA